MGDPRAAKNARTTDKRKRAKTIQQAGWTIEVPGDPDSEYESEDDESGYGVGKDGLESPAREAKAKGKERADRP